MTQNIETHLREALEKHIEPFSQCALLDYPDHLNAGDHLIWIGTCIFLVQTRGAKVTYTSSLVDFNQGELKEKNGSAPIFLQGGGNLGDIWPDSQKFREQVIQDNHDCPIYILPQSIYFENQSTLEEAKDVFNAHPNLTIFLRDNRSLELARTYFPQTKTVLSPDMAFFLAPTLKSFFNEVEKIKNKFLVRADKEANVLTQTNDAKKSDSVVEDWHSYSWAYTGRGAACELTGLCKQYPECANWVREYWQRGLSKPAWLGNRLRWRSLKPESEIMQMMPNKAQSAFSWNMAFDAAMQIAECRELTTDRLHAHILAVILVVKNTLLANSYHKNEQFFSTWTSEEKNSNFSNYRKCEA
ncbi:MAG: polysaccharide pyruvyl transferase family protein [Leptolyngbya sp.]|nr:polysaccharide pyruvyl transferase family protein [Candidatus Melainabacteria bacterium]